MNPFLNTRKFWWAAMLFLSCWLILPAAQAQLPLGANIENLTDQQILVLMTQYQLIGLSDVELEMKAREKGLNSEQISQLKKRMALIDPSTLKELNGPQKNSSDLDEARTKINSKSPKSFSGKTKEADSAKTLQPFGAELFQNESLSFEPNLQLATPVNYLIGTNDQLVIDVYGVSDITKRLRVSPEGTIRYPNLGPVKVGGLTIEEARTKLRKELARIYPGINNGSVSVQVSLGQIRSIRVTLIGEVRRPGNYELSSLTTLMNALYASGGPNELGSLRNIELVRNGKNIATFDLYDFLLKSDLTKNLLLQDGDVIRIQPYSKRIALQGAVKKPALFEVKPNETAGDIIQYAGGLSDMAFKEWARVFRLGDRGKSVLTVKQSDLNTFKLNGGDTLEILTISDKFTNRVSIQGAVQFPGQYGLGDMKRSLRNLLLAANLREDAYYNRAIIRRLQGDLSSEIIPFHIGDVLNGDSYIEMYREDSVYVFSTKQLRERYTVTIEGEVNQPGTFDFSKNMRVQDLVLMAGGYKAGASLQRIEISRRLAVPDKGTGDRDSAVYSLVKTINLGASAVQDLAARQKEELDFLLQPFDIIAVRKSPVYKEQISVSIEGEVVYPGNYTLRGNAERISDLVQRAGGLKQKGFAGGAVLIRKTFRDVSAADATLINSRTNLINTQSGIASAALSPTANNTDTAALNNAYKQQKPVGIHLDKILENPGSPEDLFLLEGDILKVPRELQTIQTFGAVNVPKQIVYTEGLRFKDALRESGRYAMNASRKNSYVIYPNGQVRKTRNYLFFRDYPSIRPGTEIYVPAKRPKQKMTTGEYIGIFTGLTSLVSVLIVLANSK